jgi:hypothetical protein
MLSEFHGPLIPDKPTYSNFLDNVDKYFAQKYGPEFLYDTYAQVRRNFLKNLDVDSFEQEESLLILEESLYLRIKASARFLQMVTYSKEMNSLGEAEMFREVGDALLRFTGDEDMDVVTDLTCDAAIKHLFNQKYTGERDAQEVDDGEVSYGAYHDGESERAFFYIPMRLATADVFEFLTRIIYLGSRLRDRYKSQISDIDEAVKISKRGEDRANCAVGVFLNFLGPENFRDQLSPELQKMLEGSAIRMPRSYMY